MAKDFLQNIPERVARGLTVTGLFVTAVAVDAARPAVVVAAEAPGVTILAGTSGMFMDQLTQGNGNGNGRGRGNEGNSGKGNSGGNGEGKGNQPPGLPAIEPPRPPQRPEPPKPPAYPTPGPKPTVEPHPTTPEPVKTPKQVTSGPAPTAVVSAPSSALAPSSGLIEQPGTSGISNGGGKGKSVEDVIREISVPQTVDVCQDTPTIHYPTAHHEVSLDYYYKFGKDQGIITGTNTDLRRPAPEWYRDLFVGKKKAEADDRWNQLLERINSKLCFPESVTSNDQSAAVGVPDQAASDQINTPEPVGNDQTDTPDGAGDDEEVVTPDDTGADVTAQAVGQPEDVQSPGQQEVVDVPSDSGNVVTVVVAPTATTVAPVQATVVAAQPEPTVLSSPTPNVIITSQHLSSETAASPTPTRVPTPAPTATPVPLAASNSAETATPRDLHPEDPNQEYAQQFLENIRSLAPEDPLPLALGIGAVMVAGIVYSVRKSRQN